MRFGDVRDRTLIVERVQVAAWLGHSPTMLLSTYAHVIAELDPDDRTSASARAA